MPIAEDRPKVAPRATASSGSEIYVWREANFGKIWIATCSSNQNEDDVRHFVSIELALPEPKHTEGHDSEKAPQRATCSSGRISVNLPTELLADANMAARLKICGMTLSDPIAFELAIGIVESCSLKNVNTYTKSCMVKMLCAQIIDSASTSIGLPRCRSTGLADWQRATVETALSKGNNKDLSLESFATRCGLSVCHFARLFRVTYDLPFHQYMVERKIFQACGLLSGTQDSISQIALECGFSDQSSFTRRFSAKIGQSPATWRKIRFSQGARPSPVAESLVT